METTRARALIAIAIVGVVIGLAFAWPRGGAAQAPSVDTHGDRAWLSGRKIDLNRADARSLARISGIGPALAARIVAARTERGGAFTSWDQVDGVAGIGPKLQARIEELCEIPGVALTR